MAEEIDDYGFYREDFSAESEWEIFNAQLCELFQKWELPNVEWGRNFQPGELYQCEWNMEKELLDVKGNQVSVTYYRAQLKTKDKNKAAMDRSVNAGNVPPMHEDLLSLDNTFAPSVFNEAKNLHWLARFYGLRRFVVLTPCSEQSNFITKRSEFSFFFSAISVVATEVCASVPIFVQIYDKKWDFFLGHGITSYMRTSFDLVAVEKPPQDYCYLSGLLMMFKEKLPRLCKQPALVSVRNIYALEKVKLRVPMYVPFGMTPLVDEDRSIISLSYFTALPHGYSPHSHTQLFAIFTWPELTENMVIDSPMQTQFVPTKAPCGILQQFVHATSYLTSCIRDFHNLITATNVLESYVGRNFTGTLAPSEVANPLEQLTKPQLGKLPGHRQVKRNEDIEGQTSVVLKKLPGPMNEHELNQMLYYLFPDLHPTVALFPYEDDDRIQDPHRIKSAKADSLVHRLSCLLATCNAHFGSKSGMAQLWATFTRELRLLWDNCVAIPGVAEGFPDTRTCLLHQKLQMLNICIERRLQREQGVYVIRPHWPEPRSYAGDEAVDDNDNDTEEEFYDCDEDDDKRSESPVKSTEATKPEGRLKRLGALKLLDSEEYLYIPITQEAIPKTEDKLQDDADVMLKLGTSSDHVTAMMCSTLQSDTEAFKAANLSASFEDFIRWYSPNDWEEFVDEEGAKQHKLSARMKAEGNTWQTVWEQAKAVPVSRQKRLFDDTYEGYKVLKYLETRNLGEIYGLTIVPLLHSSILKLKNIFLNSHVLELFSESLDELLADLSRFARDIEIVAGSPTSAASSSSSSNTETNYVLQLPNPEVITRKIEQLESQYYQYECFKQMPAISTMNLQLIQNKFKEILQNKGSCTITPKHIREGEVDVKNTEVEERLMSSFKRDMQDKLISKDYVIREGKGLNKMADRDGERDDEKAEPVMPQFLRAIVTGEELRLCGAFTENTTFLD